MTALRYQVHKDFFRAYDAISDLVLSQFTPEQQRVIREERVAQGERRAELRAVQFDEETKLLAEYESRRNQAKINLRTVDPELDAWLMFFGRTDAVRTAHAQALFDRLVAEKAVPATGKVMVSPMD